MDNGSYYRFNAPGIAENRLETQEYDKHIIQATDHYIDSKELQDAIALCKSKITRRNQQPNMQPISFDLDNLQIAKGAMYDAYSADHTICLEGTRTELLGYINRWAEDPQKERIFWLCGMAGTGKSTISCSMADMLSKRSKRQCLGANFFFKHGEREQGNASRFFSTIAYQLARRIPGLSQLVQTALEANPLLCEKTLQEQFEKLLDQPLAKLKKERRGLPHGIVIMIDALDECDREEHVRMILRLLSRIDARIFVTSRPELPIQLGFKLLNDDLHRDVILEEISSTTIKEDLTVYITHHFSAIKAENDSLSRFSLLPADWPGDNTTEELVSLAMPLFIFAATVCRYVSGRNPQRRLDVILQKHTHGALLGGLSGIYYRILNQMVIALKEEAREDAVLRFKQLIGPMVVLAEPLSLIALSNLLETPRTDIEEMLGHLQSIFHVPTSDEFPVRALHLSFRDFLTYKRSDDGNDFYVDEVQTHTKLLQCCLRRLTQPGVLFDDICKIDDPGTRRDEVSKTLITSCIPADVTYACQYWVQYLVRGQAANMLFDGGDVHEFLKRHLLHWIEVLNWLGQLSSIIGHISQLQLNLTMEEAPQMSTFLEDARRFVLRNRHIVNEAPLQLYYSALYFPPLQSITRKQFEHKCFETFSVLPKAPLDWSLEIQKLEEHSYEVTILAFSPDGSMIATGIKYMEQIRLWNSQTGEELYRLEGPGKAIDDLVFSSDGELIASLSYNGQIRIWETRTGEDIQQLATQHGRADAIVFTPQRKILESPAWNPFRRPRHAWTNQETYLVQNYSRGWVGAIFSKTKRLLVCIPDSRGDISIWNAESGDMLSTLVGYDFYGSCATFSPDGSILASVSSDVIHMWNAWSGDELHELQSDDVARITFSPDGELIAAGCYNGQIRLWKTKTGKDIMTVTGPRCRASDVEFSPNGKMIAAAFEHEIRLWDIQTGQQKNCYQGHEGLIRVFSFSPDSKMIASSSVDCTVRLWATKPENETALSQGRRRSDTFDQESFSDHSKITFSPGGNMVVTAFEGITQLWDIKTCEQIFQIPGNARTLRMVTFSPDESVLAFAYNNEPITLWKIQTRRPNMTFCMENESPIRTLAFSPCGTKMATASYDSIFVRDIKTYQVLQEVRIDHVWPALMAFSPDGSKLAWSESGSAQLWDFSMGQKPFLTRDTFLQDWSSNHEASPFDTFDTEYDELQARSRRASMPTDSTRSPIRQSGLTLDSGWVVYEGREILWLPHEYRGVRFAGNRDTLIVLATTGVSFFQLRN
ncbi:WD40 repeat-like protein [Myriangium duriaei CBS 260.36]|uniref:WD40 repeat-like protein n=1 Tax=Myriangium duriaei CBS 260.36 TaxID=1168546 RepID=A0A9P4J1L6_9PEZI|nr:WD40 repeat-like protein [Myriangium duriaei CBS 260.36]